MRRHPYSVILLDEVEKAHPDVWNVFLQILDEGQLTDGKGRKVNMKNTIIIMTSNIGSQYIGEIQNMEERQNMIQAELRKYFRIEFLNRIDDVVIYNSLSESDIHKITELLLQEVTERLRSQGIEVTWGEEVIDLISTR